MQCSLRQGENDEFAGIKAHKYGSSPSNQRIECWWSSFEHGRASWWIDDMANTGLLDLGNILHMECLWFCFHGVLQEDLDNVRLHWNTHRIRPSRHGTVPGIPEVLYHLPERSGGVDCKVNVSCEKIQDLQLHIQDDDDLEGERIIYQDYFHYVMESENFRKYPDTYVEAYDLFSDLIRIGNR